MDEKANQILSVVPVYPAVYHSCSGIFLLPAVRLAVCVLRLPAAEAVLPGGVCRAEMVQVAGGESGQGQTDYPGAQEYICDECADAWHLLAADALCRIFK